jgi:hypothetical protein
MSDDRLPKKSALSGRSFWLGSDHSAVNVNRFWLYLGGIGFTLCAVCLVRAIETFGHR